MKLKIKYSAIIIVLGMLLFNTSCEEKEFAIPPLYIPSADTSDGTVITIDQFKNLASLGDNEVYLIDSSLYVRGVITANDVSGNLYKELYIRDNTGGLKLSINAKSLYLKYLVGQTVYLSCKGFYLGHYFDVPIFGGPLADNGRPGRIEENELDEAILLDGLPSLSAPELEPNIVGITEVSIPNDLSDLIKITNVTFKASGTLFGSPESYPERVVVDANGNEMVLSMSAYSNFALDTIPSYAVDITGVLSNYQDTPQLKVRDINDIVPTESK